MLHGLAQRRRDERTIFIRVRPYQEVYSPDCSGADTGGGDPGNDTGDTGSSPIPDAANCPLGADRWEMEFAFEVDTCGYGAGNPNPWSATLTCYPRDFAIVLDPIGWPLWCSWDGASFGCWEKWGGTIVSLDGAVEGSEAVVNGTLDVDYGACISRGEYAARAAPE